MNATRAIFDANNTTLIVAVLLYIYGTGPIKGFAVTMGIGILASIITAIIGTQGIYIWLGEKINNTKKINFWFGIRVKNIATSRAKSTNQSPNTSPNPKAIRPANQSANQSENRHKSTNGAK